jgi:hypothetical protein
MSLRPGEDYARQQAGQPDGRFEADARLYQCPDLLLVDVGDGRTGTTATLVLEATKPDPRLSLEIQIGFNPIGQHAGVATDSVTLDGDTVAQNLALSTVWLSLLGDFGSGIREIEDIIGTKAAPEQLVAAGLWGATYEVDVDVIGVRLALVLESPGVFGRWLAVARWTGSEEMSQRDWEHARQKMQLFRTPRGVDLIQYYENPS